MDYQKLSDTLKNSPSAIPSTVGKIYNQEEDKEDKGLTGGHQQNFKMLDDGTLLKISSQQEYQFYMQLYSSPITGKYYCENQELADYVPKFHGMSTMNGKECIQINDITFGMTNPSCMDIKIGKNSTSPDYSKEKAEKAKAKEASSTTGSHGFRITGLSIKDNTGKTVFKLLKDYSMKYPQTLEYLQKYFTTNGTHPFDKAACNYFLKQMKKIKQFFKNTNTRYFISTSLLFAFSSAEKKYDAKLIDFAHVGPLEMTGEGRDTNFLWGIKGAIASFEEALLIAIN